MKLKIFGHLSEKCITNSKVVININKKTKTKILKEKYKVSDSDLKKMGLIKEDFTLFSGRLTKEEKKSISLIAYKKDTDMTSLMRNQVEKLLSKEKDLNDIDNNIQIKNSTINFTLNETDSQIFRNICKKRNIPLSAAIRSLALDIIKESEGK